MQGKEERPPNYKSRKELRDRRARDPGASDCRMHWTVNDR